jgi:integrase
VLIGAERVRRGGFPSRSAAEAARDELLARSAEDATAETWTVARWLTWWLSTRSSLRPSTLRSYTNHVQLHLIPYLGRIRLAELTGRDVAEMFTMLTEAPTRHGRPMTPASLHRIRATLRAALNTAIRDGLLRDNPARHVQLPRPRRPPALVWTKTRVQAWVDRGERSTVAVWTEHQLVAFLDFVAADRLYAMWWLIALRGLRRGEAAGLRWCDLDLEDRALTVNQQRLAYGTTVTVGPPKAAASRRTVALDRTTVTVLRAHRRRQEKERAAAGQAWQDTGYVFTTTDGQPLHPGLPHPPLPRPRDQLRAAASAAARLASRRGQPGPLRRRGPQDSAGAGRAQQHRAHRRHLHQRPHRQAPQGRPGHRPSRPGRRSPRPETAQATCRRPAVKVRC